MIVIVRSPVAVSRWTKPRRCGPGRRAARTVTPWPLSSRCSRSAMPSLPSAVRKVAAPASFLSCTAATAPPPPAARNQWLAWTTSPGCGCVRRRRTRPARRDRRRRPSWERRQDERGAVAPQPAARLAVAGHVALDERPEAPRMVHDDEVAGLVPDDVVEHRLGGEDEAPVEAHGAGRRAAAPPRALVADGEGGGRGDAERSCGVLQTRRDLGSGLGAVPALEGVVRPALGHVQHVVLAVRPGSVRVVVKAQMGTEERDRAGRRCEAGSGLLD